MTQVLYQRVPLRALVLSIAALIVPIAGAFSASSSLGDYDVLLWLLALIPAFLLAYYRGWRGAAAALAGGMLILALTQLALRLMGIGFQNWTILLACLLAFIGCCLGAGWVAEALHRERALAQRSTLDTTLVLSAAGECRYAGTTLESIIGRAPATIVGRSFADFVDPDDFPQLESLLATTPGSPRTAELRFRHGDGSWRILEITATNHLEDPAVVGVVFGVRDLTDRKVLEQQLRLRHRMEVTGKLAAGVAHDFNNLLTAIEGHARLVLDGGALRGDDRSSIQEIVAASERAATITRRLLAFSRQQVLLPRTVPIADVVQEADPLVRRLAGEDIEVITSIEGEPGWVHVDPTQIQQALVNLAVHARENMPSGGRLTIRIARRIIDPAFAAGFPYPVKVGDYGVLSVSDEGHGYDANEIDRLFEPFDPSLDPDFGSRLALSEVYGIVKQSGGYIWVESGRGKGTTFLIFLPIVDAPEQPLQRNDRNADRPSVEGSETVLVVEDDDQVRSLVRRVLLGAGYSVLEATDGNEALRVAREYRRTIDLLLTDVVMPELTGLELAHRLAEFRPEMRVLLVSGYTEAAIMSPGFLDPETPFLQKPFTPTELLNRIREVLGTAHVTV